MPKDRQMDQKDFRNKKKTGGEMQNTQNAQNNTQNTQKKQATDQNRSGNCR